jgi:hypothetical protein
MKKLIWIILIIISACKSSYLAMTNFKVPDGTPMFQEGYRDGCSTMLGMRSTVLYRMKYNGYKYNPDYIDNPEYKFGYSRGYSYCFNYIVGAGYFGQGAADTYITGKGTPFPMGTDNWNNTVNYQEGSWTDAMNVGGYGGTNGVWSYLQSSEKGGFSTMGSHPLYGTNSSQIFGW